MSTGPEIVIDSTQFVAALKALEARQQKLNDLTQAFGPKAAKAYTLAEAAAKRASAGPSAFTVAMEANTAAVQSNKQAFQQLSEPLSQLGSAVAAIDPSLGAMVMGLQKVATAGQAASGILSGASTLVTAFGVGAAASAVVAAPLLLFMEHLDRQAAKTAESMRLARSASLLLGQGMQSVVDTEAELDAQLNVLNGTMTQGQVNALRASTAAAAAYDDTLQGLGVRTMSLKKQIADLAGGPQDNLDAAFGKSGIERELAMDELEEQLTATNKETEEFTRRQQDSAEKAGLVAEAAYEQAEALRGTTAARRDDAEATRAQEEAERARAAAIQASLDLMDKQTKEDREDRETVKAALDSLSASYVRHSHDVRAAFEAEREALDAQLQRGIAAAENDAQRTALLEAHHKAVVALAADEVAANAKAQNAILAKERAAAAESRAIAAAKRDTLLGAVSGLGAAAADAFGEESKVAKAAALVQIAINAAQAEVKALTLGPVGFAAYTALIAATTGLSVAKVMGAGAGDEASSEESYNDTPGTQRRKAGPQGLRLNFAPGDDVEFRSARRPQDLDRQGGGAGANVSTTVRFVVSGRTAQSITTSSANTTRGRPPGSPIPGRSRAR